MTDAARNTLTHSITLVPLPLLTGERYPSKGRRAIMVDGRRWGRANMEGSGRSTKYWFQQEGAGHAIEDAKGRIIEVRPQGRRRWHHDKDPIPTERLLLDQVEKLIDDGKLMAPIEYQAMIAAREAAWRKAQARAAAKEAEEFQERAREAIEALGIDGSDISHTMIDTVVAAMRWAQSK